MFSIVHLNVLLIKIMNEITHTSPASLIIHDQGPEVDAFNPS